MSTGKDEKMYFYPHFMTEEVAKALRDAGFDAKDARDFCLRGLVADDGKYSIINEDEFIIHGIHIVRKPKTFDGYIPNPRVYSSLEGGMVPTGVAQYQCEKCGFWMDRKMTPSDEKRHDQQCCTQYEWCLKYESNASSGISMQG